jgi:hypothetical protein
MLVERALEIGDDDVGQGNRHVLIGNVNVYAHGHVNDQVGNRTQLSRPARMFVVAVVQLPRPIEEEAQSLAIDLGSAPYDVRLLLATGLPAIVLMTTVKSAAVECGKRWIPRRKTRARPFTAHA